jgi:hypothetical protein
MLRFWENKNSRSKLFIEPITSSNLLYRLYRLSNAEYIGPIHGNDSAVSETANAITESWWA